MDNPFVRGSVSGLVTCTLVQPFDVIKTNIITVNKEFSIFQSFQYVHQKYGPQGFWRGMRPAGYKAIIGSGMSFSLFETFKALVPPSSTGFASNSLVALVSRGVCITAMAPLSILKVRMEAPQVAGYKTVFEGFQSIYINEGIRGFYQGLGSCLMRDLPFSGLAYGLYEKFYELSSERYGTSIWIRAICGGVAGFTATLLTQPFDVIKTRQQFRKIGDHQNFEYKNLLDALIKIYQQEGIKGFTIGLNIRLVERSTAFAIVWFIYERLKSFSHT
jgi:solute carrier family 25 protein 38